MDYVQTASARRFDSDYFVVLENQALLFVRILNEKEDTIRSVFENPEETSCLTSKTRVAFGYIYLKSITQEGDAFKVVLSKNE